MAKDDDPRWKIAERVAAIFEQILMPGASVQVDEKLPDLTTGELRQCDVIIRHGTAPREYLAIVEVQARGRKPEIATFDGWWAKKNAVGAHMLICVSEKGFPASVKKTVAMKHGPAVKLVTVEELDTAFWPELIVFRTCPFSDIHYEVQSAKPMFDRRDAPTEIRGELSRAEKVFEVGDTGELITINDLIDKTDHLDHAVLGREDGEHNIEFTIDLRVIPHYFVHGGQRNRVWEVDVQTLVTLRRASIVPTVLEYVDVSTTSTKTWMLKMSGTINEKEFDVRHTFLFDEVSNEYRIRTDVLRAPDGVGRFSWRILMAVREKKSQLRGLEPPFDQAE